LKPIVISYNNKSAQLLTHTLLHIFH